MMSQRQNTPLSTSCKKRFDLRAITAVWAVLLLATWCTGCVETFGGITYYDPTTYKNMTDLKPEVLMLYDTFTSDPVDAARVFDVRLKFAQAYEYEKGKGDKNRETYEQISIIQRMFERHIAERTRDGKWNEANLSNKKENIGAAFDTAIRTERSKNKND
jgi:hypothetical protein